MNDWVLLAANCPCCGVQVYPLRLELTKAAFESVGYSSWEGSYYQDGQTYLTGRVVWSDGSTTSKSSITTASCNAAGIAGGFGEERISIGDDVYVTETTQAYDKNGEVRLFSAFVQVHPDDYAEMLTVGDGSSAVGFANFIKQ